MSELQNYKISWDDAKIVKFSENRITMVCPKLVHPETNSQISGLAVVFQLKIGTESRCYKFSEIEVKIELLVYKKDYIISVVGLTYTQKSGKSLSVEF